MKKILLTILIIIIAVITLAFLNLESIVKTAVNKYGSEVTGTDVSLDGFKLDIFKGQATISKLSVGNPKGYNAANIFELNNVFVSIDLKSITTNTIVINEINIKQPIITFEALSLQQNNIKQLQANIDANLPQSQKTESIATEESKSESTPSKSFLIKKFELSKATVEAYLPNIKPQSLELPTITLTNIDGNPQKQIATILEKIITNTTKAVANLSTDKLEELAQESLNKITDSVKNKINLKGLF